jgi:hypothetical protein
MTLSLDFDICGSESEQKIVQNIIIFLPQFVSYLTSIYKWTIAFWKR